MSQLTSRILFFGDIVGEPGRKALMRALPELRERYSATHVIANAENAAGGRGLTPKIAQDLLRNGLDAITLGDHVWDQKDLIHWMDREVRLLRPLNLQVGSPGHSIYIIEKGASKIGLFCLHGRTFMKTGAENPFTHASQAVEKLHAEGCHSILVDFHAETTSEKIAMGYHLDGKVSAVVGTHTHVQTSDARILPKGSAHITDLGMCGPRDSVIGRDISAVLQSMTSSIPCVFPIAKWPVQLSGVLIEIDNTSGKATHIEAINHIVEQKAASILSEPVQDSISEDALTQ